MSVRHSNNTLDKYIAEHDLQRIEYLISNDEKGAEKLAKQIYSKIKTKSKKKKCSSDLCVIFNRPGVARAVLHTAS